LEEECSRINALSSFKSGHLVLRVLMVTPQQPEASSCVEQKDTYYYVDKYFKLSFVAYRKRQYSLALKYAKRGEEISSSDDTPSQPSCASGKAKAITKLSSECVELQADCELAMGRDVKAVELYRNTISMRVALYSNDKHMSIAKCVSAVSNIYRRHHAYSLALHYALYLRDICDHNGLAISAEMAMALSHIAMVKRCQELFEEACDLEMLALQMRRTELGDKHPAVARSYHR
jgi:hypothetical protein